MTQRTMDRGGRQLAYDETGPQDAPAVLLLPWLGGSRLGWQGVAQALAGDYRVLSLDHRDTGDSAPFAAPYTLADLADDAAELLRQTGAVPALVVGLSMGGMVAQHLALRHPEVVRALVLVATTPGGAGSTPATDRGRAALFLPAELEAGERARQALALMAADGLMERHPEAFTRAEANARQHPMSAESYKRQFGAVRGHDTTAGLPEIGVPTLILHGESDDLVPLPNAERLQAIPGAQFRTYPDTGHMPHIERPGEFLTDLRGFLDTVR